jgi:pyruvate-formate lyase
MYTFRPATDRVLRLRQQVRDRVIRGDSERPVLKAEAYVKYKYIVPIIRRPMITRDICRRMTIRVEDDELFVGNRTRFRFGSECVGWILRKNIEETWSLKEDGFWHNPDSEDLRLILAQEDIDKIREVTPILKENTPGNVSDSWQPAGAKEFFELEASDYAVNGTGIMWAPCGHLIPGWGKILNVGYGEIRKQAQDYMDAREGNIMGNDMSKYLFYQSVAIACDAATTLIKRYSAACAEKAEATEDPKRRAELLGMAESLMWISEHPARNFWEACQATLLYQLFLGIDDRYPGPAYGRFDQYTWPFLKKDLKEGKLTLDEAQELVDCFFLKSNCFYEVATGAVAAVTGIGNTYYHTTVGGVLPETGEDATNPVTYMVLETVGRLKQHDPTISLRVHKGTPDKLWELALTTSKLVGGLPLFQNDEIIIPALQKELGFTLRDARDYGIIGCQEIVGSGNDYPAGNGVHAHASIHHGVVFAMAINNGCNPMNGKQAKLKTGYLYEMHSIEEVREAYQKMADYILKWYVTINNYAEYLTPYNMPHAALSLSMEGCMEKGLDCTAGGCKYNSYGGTATGLATIADCLSTVKYMCFDKKLVTTRRLYDAVMANWEGYEPLRQQILSEVPHFGNADSYADQEMTWVMNNYLRMCGECSSQRARVYKAGLYGASDHIIQGYHTWATPDGRKAGEPIADAGSPAQSRDKNGPTAVFLSTCCYDHSRFMDGIALNLRMHPTVLSRDDGIAKLRDMTKAYFENGGMEVQYNVVDTDTLRAAQADPKTYRDLVVRIAGYSAYFVELNRDCQNDIIARNENRI